MAKKQSKAKRLNPRTVWNSNQEPGPTPETVAKRQPDVIETLHHENLLDTDQHNAAMEIRELREALTRGIFSGAADYSAPLGGKAGREQLRGLEALKGDVKDTGTEYGKWAQIYKPWSNSEGKRQIAPGFTRLQLVDDIVWEGYWPQDMDSLAGMIPGTSLYRLREALDNYLRQAGRV